MDPWLGKRKHTLDLLCVDLVVLQRSEQAELGLDFQAGEVGQDGALISGSARSILVYDITVF